MCRSRSCPLIICSLPVYRTKIDGLTKRFKSVENAFLSLYKVSAEAPNPYLLLETAVVHCHAPTHYANFPLDSSYRTRPTVKTANSGSGGRATMRQDRQRGAVSNLRIWKPQRKGRAQRRATRGEGGCVPGPLLTERGPTLVG